MVGRRIRWNENWSTVTIVVKWCGWSAYIVHVKTFRTFDLIQSGIRPLHYSPIAMMNDVRIWHGCMSLICLSLFIYLLFIMKIVICSFHLMYRRLGDCRAATTPCCKKSIAYNPSYPTTTNDNLKQYLCDSRNFWYKYYLVNMPSNGGLIYHLTCLLYVPCLGEI